MEPTSNFPIGGNVPIQPSGPSERPSEVRMPSAMLPAKASAPVELTEEQAKEIGNLSPQRDSNVAILSHFKAPFEGAVPFLNQETISNAVETIAKGVLGKPSRGG